MITAQIAQILRNLEVVQVLGSQLRLSHLAAVVIRDLFLFLDYIVYLGPIVDGWYFRGAQRVIGSRKESVKWLMLFAVDGLVGHLQLAFGVAPGVLHRATLRHEHQVVSAQNAV